MKNTFIRSNPDTSWLNGNFPNINAEINTRLPYVAIGEYFWQGDEADNVIDEIHQIWVNSDMDIEQSIQKYAFAYL